MDIEQDMNGCSTLSQEDDWNGSSCGIKKIVDCKVGPDGQQMYKVIWSETWEPADTLLSHCQHLINDFWGGVNKAKALEHVAQQVIQRGKTINNNNNNSNSNNSNSNIDMYRLSDDSKAGISDLIARSNSTSAGIISPSSKLTKSNEQIPNFNTNTHTNTVTPKIKTETKPPTPSSTSTALSNSSLKYLENFDNPYVKVIVVCKVCNKEASKSSGKWKIHYLTHVSEEERPHKCDICGAGFVQKIQLTNHMKKHAKEQLKLQGGGGMKGEYY